MHMCTRKRAQSEKIDECLRKGENNNIKEYNMWSANEVYRKLRTAAKTDKNKQKC